VLWHGLELTRHLIQIRKICLKNKIISIACEIICRELYTMERHMKVLTADVYIKKKKKKKTTHGENDLICDFRLSQLNCFYAFTIFWIIGTFMCQSLVLHCLVMGKYIYVSSGSFIHFTLYLCNYMNVLVL